MASLLHYKPCQNHQPIWRHSMLSYLLSSNDLAGVTGGAAPTAPTAPTFLDHVRVEATNLWNLGKFVTGKINTQQYEQGLTDRSLPASPAK
jgi:hypothetical protein